MLQTGASNNLNVHGEPRHRRFHGSARFRFFHTFQTEYFRATAARKYLVSPRIADCAPGLAAGFDSFTVSRRNISAYGAKMSRLSAIATRNAADLGGATFPASLPESITRRRSKPGKKSAGGNISEPKQNSRKDPKHQSAQSGQHERRPNPKRQRLSQLHSFARLVHVHHHHDAQIVVSSHSAVDQ